MKSAVKHLAPKKRKSGIPTGNAGEYFVMGELLRRGYDAQLADRNTQGYDLLVGRSQDMDLKKVQVKTVRTQPWYVRRSSYVGKAAEQVTIYVLLGKEDGAKHVRYFIVKNLVVAKHVTAPANWPENGFMNLKAIEEFEGQWANVLG